MQHNAVEAGPLARNERGHIARPASGVPDSGGRGRRAPSHRPFRVRTYIFVELALWLTGPLLFLAMYVVKYHNPPIVILEHLYLVGLLAAYCLLVKVCLRRVLPWRLLADAISTVNYVTVLMTLSAYYLLVLMGLRSWGRVITQELIVAGASQAPALCETIGISFFAVVAGVVVMWTLLVALHFVLARRWEPVWGVSRLPAILTTVLVFCMLALVLHRMYIFATLYSSDTTTEPMRLTAFSGKGPAVKRDHTVAHNPAFDQEEAAARSNYRVAPTAQRRNVVLIVADGLRSDNMQSYGYQRTTTPYFERMRSRNQWEQFNDVHSYCAESNCGMASLLSSRDANRVATVPFTLVEVLQRHGYAVHMIMGGDQTNYYNKRALFGNVDSFFDGSMASGYYSADDSFLVPKTKELSEWNGKPTMLQFHFMSTHILGKRIGTYKRFTPSETYAGVITGVPEPRYTNYYDNGVVQFDDYVRQVLETLRAKKYLDNAIVIVTSDHGESLGEKGQIMHGYGVHEPVLRIPLMIAGLAPRPGKAIGTTPFIAQQDIAPTVLHELGMTLPTSWTGQPIQLLEAAGKNRGLLHFAMHEHAGVYDGREAGRQWKYSVNNVSKEEFVYDLRVDPAEIHNLILKMPKALVDEWRRSVAAQ